jgi:hypothetical protein
MRREHRGYNQQPNSEGTIINKLAAEIAFHRRRFGDDFDKIKTQMRLARAQRGEKLTDYYFEIAWNRCANNK